MIDRLTPRDNKDVEEAVLFALTEGRTLELVGQGSKRALGRPVQSDMTLDLSALSGVTLYEPEELVLSARAGTPIADIERVVAEAGQELAFEPMNYGPLLGGAPDGGTIGGVLATNLSGPRRIKAGAARDHFLGASAVSGRAETFKTGGRVVKNVTGYDLCKLLAGSYGTLCAMTDVTIKVLPRAETEVSVIALDLDDQAAIQAMSAAMGSSCDVSGAAHLPEAIAKRIPVLGFDGAATVFRLEGVAPSVSHRTSVLRSLLASYGAAEVTSAADSRAIWRAIRDVHPFADGSENPVWRISTAPMQGANVAKRIGAEASASFFFDWAGGLIWAEVPQSDDAGAAAVRAAVAEAGGGGHATLVRAPAAIRASVEVFQPQEEGLAALTRRVKESFDPKRILNPGRMWAGV